MPALRPLSPAPLALGLFCLLRLAVPAVAQPPAAPWEEPFHSDAAAVARAAAALPAVAGEPAQILFFEDSYRYDEAGRETRVRRSVYRIESETAHESWSVVSQRWSPWYQERPEIRARVITPDGQSHPLDPAVLAENGVGSASDDLFDDARLLRGPLPATGPGAVVEAEVTVRGSRPLFERGTVRAAYPGDSVTTRRARVIVDVPESLPLHWSARLLPPLTPREERAEGRRRLTFEFADLPGAKRPEPALPPDVPRGRSLAFATGASWNEVARGYAEIVDRAIAGADVSSLTAGLRRPTREEAATRILARMAPIRYTAVELGEGGIVPRPPAETLRRRFGDCKDKAVLLVAALRSLAIPAHVALLDAGEDEADVEESLPGLGAFDHAIVVVPGEPPLWIDPTDPYARPGELPDGDQGRLALIASPTATGLTRTPEATAADNLEVETREFHLAAQGPARVVEVTEYRGAAERWLRAVYAAADREKLRASLSEYAAETYLAKKLADLTFSPPDQLAQPFQLKLQIEEAGRGVSDVRHAAVALLPGDLLRRLPSDLTAAPEEDEAKREHDYRFTMPHTVELRYRVVPPAGFAPGELPAGGEQALGTAKLTRDYAALPNGEVTALWRFDSGKRQLSPAELADLRQALRELAGEDPTMLLFEQTGEGHLEAGRVGEALGEFQRLVGGAPKSALPRTRLARALLAGGLGDAARAEAEAAVALEPASALAHATRGWVLQHDAIGRRFGAGSSRDEALAAMRKAQELDPENLAARGDLAILLEHAADGRRYASQDDLAAAIAEYQSLRQDLGETAFDDNLLLALMYAGRFAEMKALLDEVERDESRDLLRLVALAAAESPDAALRQAERTWGDAGQRLQALQGAAFHLMSARRYAEASALLGRAGQKSSDAAALLASSEMLRRIKRREEMVLDPAAPETPLLRLQIAVIDNSGLEGIRPLLTERVIAFLEAGGAAELAAARRQIARVAEKANLPVEVALEMGLGAMRPTRSGDDQVGYRVELTAASGGQSHRAVGWVVRAGDRYLVAGLEEHPGTLGLEALHRLGQGDLAAARQWLDWAREERDELRAEDPLLDDPFSVLWKKGREAGEAEVRCAAAALAAEVEDAPQAAVLESCRAAAEAAGQPERTLAFDLALAELYADLERPADMLPVARRLAAAHPDSPLGFSLTASALGRLERWPELRRAADERLARLPDDEWAKLVLADLALRDGDVARQQSLLRPLAEAAKVNPGVLNNLAWGALVQGRADEQALDWAQRATTMSGYQDAASLHTLAAIYAEQGRGAEAYQVLMQSLAAEDDPAPDEDDWYVLGRLAEGYGQSEAARALYRRAIPKDVTKKTLSSTLALAQARLAGLGAGKKR